MKKLIKQVLAMFDIAVTRKTNLDRLLKNQKNTNCVDDIEFLKAIRLDARGKCLDFLEKSESQLRQDLFVLAELNFKTNGFFVEFGATNGVNLSNTYLLEKEFSWSGILAEPAKIWHKELRQNRSAVIDTRCVWKTSGEKLTFNETSIGELSTIDSYSAKDYHGEARKVGKRYKVDTISLLDLLEQNNAPRVIDYLSIDTEGSELEILESFDFEPYDIKVITCEHNNTPNRKTILNLLNQNGFERKFDSISKFDDWYVKSC